MNGLSNANGDPNEDKDNNSFWFEMFLRHLLYTGEF